MEHSAKGFAGIVQLLSEPINDPTKSAAWQRSVCCSHQTVQRRTEVVCPQPVRPVRAPCMVDNGMAVHPSRPRSLNNNNNLTLQRQSDMELLDFLLCQDGGFGPDVDEDGFFLGTPPVRTGNPIINDVAFRKQSFAAVAATSSPVNYSPYPTALPSPGGERGNGSYGSSSSPVCKVPSIRVEGFPSASSDSHPRRRVVSALA